MPNCYEIQSSLDWCMGRPELPGIKSKVYFVPKSNIKRWPMLEQLIGGRHHSAEYEGSFEFGYNSTFRYITVLGEKSQLTSEPQGEYPNQTQLNKLTIVYPGTNEEATMLAAYFNNSDCVFIVTDMNGRMRVVGSKDIPTKVTVSQDLGQGPTGTASTTINIEATDFVESPFYDGEVPIFSDEELQINFRGDVCSVFPSNVGVERMEGAYIQVTPVYAGSAGLPRAEISNNGQWAINKNDNQFLAIVVSDTLKNPGVRMMDIAVDISGRVANGNNVSYGVSHNGWAKYYHLENGGAVIVYDLTLLGWNTPDFTNGSTVFVNKITHKVLNIVLWDEDGDPLVPFRLFAMHTFNSINHLEWYIREVMKTGWR